MNFDGYNLRTQHYDDVIDVVEQALALTLDRAGRAFGTQGATVGFPSSNRTWVHLTWRKLDDAGGSWTGPELASAITGVHKPKLVRSHRWQDDSRSVVWRADETELVKSAAVDGSGVIASAPVLDEHWWSDLSASLIALSAHPTSRVVMAQSHLTRRVAQVFGDRDIDTTVTEWTTAHGDLHWGNITAPDCRILDWESWGGAPRGYDAAILWGHSLRVPEVADRVQRQFAEDLGSRSGLLSQLLFCSNVIRLSKNKPTPGPLVEPARWESERLLSSLAASPA
ncbi:MAG: hypothetical protein M3443_03180 [Actinomycetota bacterium]|nr:hypothetical protein [Actinomycetota bacterium]